MAGLIKRIRANHKARVQNRQTKKAVRRENNMSDFYQKQARKQVRNDIKNSRVSGRFVRRLAKNDVKLQNIVNKGIDQSVQDDMDLANSFPSVAQSGGYGGGYNSTDGSYANQEDYFEPSGVVENDPMSVNDDFDTTGWHDEDFYNEEDYDETVDEDDEPFDYGDY